ncbi:MAG: MFS transporter, partial [Gemmataceae bacterium]
PLYSIRLEHDLGFSRSFTGFCCATQAAAAVISSLITGQMADRYFSAEKALSICAVLGGLDLWLLSSLRDPAGVFFATLAFWLFTGPMILLGTTVCFTHLSQPQQEFGPVRLWGTVGWMVIGWMMTFWPGDPLQLGGMVAMLLGAYAWTLPPTPPKAAPDPGKRFAPLEAVALLREPSFAVYCLCMLGGCVPFPLTTQNTPLLLRELGITPRILTSVMTIAQVSEILSLAILPRLLRTLGLRGTMLLGIGSWLAVMLLLSLGRPLGLMIGSQILNGMFVTGFLIAGQIFVNELAESDFRASVQGLLSGINGLGGIFGNLMVGGLREWTHGRLPPTFAVGAVITFLMFLLFLIGFRKPYPSLAEELNHVRTGNTPEPSPGIHRR